MRILVVEDEPGIARDLLGALTSAGFAAEHVADGDAAWQLGGIEAFDAALLDLGLPRMDGLSLIRRWRAEGVAFPILVLSARSNWATRVEAIDAGADDFLVKPFAMEEVLARLRAILRRAAGRVSNVLAVGDLLLDLRARRLTRAGVPVELTLLEFRLLAYLMHHVGRAIHQTELSEHLYSGEADRGDNAIEALMARLRRKIGADAIRTRRGHGYVIGGDA
ncbi:MAG: response regulator transcription factor [Roseomonas sp.]